MLQTLNTLSGLHPWLFGLIIFMAGCCLGSFLNVIIYRVPRNLSIVRPGSYCTTSQIPLPWYDNIPLLSWILLGGKSRFDGRSISVRYPLVEGLTGSLFVCGWLLLSPSVALVGFPFIAVLIAGAWIDLEHQVLPDFSTIGGMLLGLVLSFCFPAVHGYSGGAFYSVDGLRSLIAAILGVLVGSGLILWIGVLAERLLKREAMGFGDVLFMGCIGSFCGWQGALFALFGGALLGSLFLVLCFLVQKVLGVKIAFSGKVYGSDVGKASLSVHASGESLTHSSDLTEDQTTSLSLGTVIPFGPWLALGAAIYYLFLREAVGHYFLMLKYVL